MVDMAMGEQHRCRNEVVLTHDFVDVVDARLTRIDDDARLPWSERQDVTVG